jgi:hypothetical protein
MLKKQITKNQQKLLKALTNTYRKHRGQPVTVTVFPLVYLALGVRIPQSSIQ